eukprot:132178-Rhodomonas_salina.2
MKTRVSAPPCALDPLFDQSNFGTGFSRGHTTTDQNKPKQTLAHLVDVLPARPGPSTPVRQHDDRQNARQHGDGRRGSSLDVSDPPTPTTGTRPTWGEAAERVRRPLRRSWRPSSARGKSICEESRGEQCEESSGEGGGEGGEERRGRRGEGRRGRREEMREGGGERGEEKEEREERREEREEKRGGKRRGVEGGEERKGEERRREEERGRRERRGGRERRGRRGRR